MFGYDGHVPMCDYAASNVLILLVICVWVVHTLMLHDSVFAPYNVPSLRTIYGTQISSEEALIYEHDGTQHYAPLGVFTSTHNA